MSALARLNLVVMATLVAHTLDHAANQPARDVPASAGVIGVAGLVIVAVSAVLAIRRSPAAPVAALFAGGITALGIVAVHLLPHWWGFVSDPYWDFGANALSWALALVPLLAGVALATAGARALGRPPSPVAINLP